MKIGRNLFLFYIGYVSYVMSIAFVVNVNITAAHFLKGFALICMLISVFEKKYSVKELINILFVMAACIYISYNIQTESILMLILFVLGYPGGDLKKIIKIDMVIRGGGIICTNICYLIGLAKDVQLIRENSSGIYVRHSLGFIHPNVCYSMVFVTTIDFLLLKLIDEKAIKSYNMIFLLIISYIYERQTGARGAFIIQWLTILGFYLEKKYKIFSNHKKISNVMSYLPLFMCLFSIFIEKMYEKIPKLGEVLNYISTNRISSMYYYWNNYNITLFGQVLNKLSTQQATILGQRAFVLDNFYFNLLLGYGLFFTVIFMIIYIKLCRSMYLFGEIYIFIVLCSFAIFGLVEGSILNIDYNYFLVLVSGLGFVEKNLNNVKDDRKMYISQNGDE